MGNSSVPLSCPYFLKSFFRLPGNLTGNLIFYAPYGGYFGVSFLQICDVAEVAVMHKMI
jgi:hypothetical protein